MFLLEKTFPRNFAVIQESSFIALGAEELACAVWGAALHDFWV